MHINVPNVGGRNGGGRGVSLVGMHTYVTRARTLLSLEAVARDS